VAEQLGYAIRQRSPDAVDRDSLRNAANSFVYVDPLTLPPSGPAASLSRAPHNFSRVFTGAFLEALGGMVVALSDPPRADDVLEASRDMGRLLAEAVVNAPIRTRFFQAVAEQLVLADGSLFDGRYAQALTTALVRRGLLPIRSLAAPAVASAPTPSAAAAAAARFSAMAAGGADAAGKVEAHAAQPVRIAFDGAAVGLPVTTLYVEAPAVDDGGVVSPRMGIAAREASGPARYSEVQAFVEDLVVRGRVNVETQVGRRKPLISALVRRRLTHQLIRVKDGMELRRLTFECRC
jgi:hypothetical protein